MATTGKTVDYNGEKIDYKKALTIAKELNINPIGKSLEKLVEKFREPKPETATVVEPVKEQPTAKKAAKSGVKVSGFEVDDEVEFEPFHKDGRAKLKGKVTGFSVDKKGTPYLKIDVKGKLYHKQVVKVTKVTH